MTTERIETNLEDQTIFYHFLEPLTIRNRRIERIRRASLYQRPDCREQSSCVTVGKQSCIGLWIQD